MAETTGQIRFISYRLETSAETAATRSMLLRFGVIFEPGQRCERYEVSFDVPVKTRAQWEAPEGVSGTIGLATGLITTSDFSNLDQIVERNLADLMTTFILDSADHKDSLSFVKGPALAKMMGRLAYRCFPQETTVAVLTCGSAYADGLIIEGYGRHPWCGPFPSLHEDSLRRTFFRVIDSDTRRLTRLRLDIFHQDFGFEEDPVNSSANRLWAKLDKVNYVLNSYPAKHQISVPRPLEILDRSLIWSNQRLRNEIEKHQDRLSEAHISKETLSNLSERGIAALEPKHAIAFNKKAEDPSYAAEILFEDLQRTVEIEGGIAEGLMHYLRTKKH